MESWVFDKKKTQNSPIALSNSSKQLAISELQHKKTHLGFVLFWQIELVGNLRISETAIFWELEDPTCKESAFDNWAESKSRLKKEAEFTINYVTAMKIEGGEVKGASIPQPTN